MNKQERLFNPIPSHDCGLCDGRLKFYYYLDDGTIVWECRVCSWTHTSLGCCEELR